MYYLKIVYIGQCTKHTHYEILIKKSFEHHTVQNANPLEQDDNCQTIPT